MPWLRSRTVNSVSPKREALSVATRVRASRSWSAGHDGAAEERARRLARPLCFLRQDPTDNGYARPLEGPRPVVDLNAMQVVRVEA